MQVLNLIRPEKSSIKYKVIQFPDGEPHIVLKDIDRKDYLSVICSKVRDPKTGQLSGFKIENPEVIEENQDLPLVVIDDLCDGGGTFKGIAQLLESHCPNRDRAIYVTHMVNPKGIATLSENYKEVYFTNSYRDWGREALPDNVKVIEVV